MPPARGRGRPLARRHITSNFYSDLIRTTRRAAQPCSLALALSLPCAHAPPGDMSGDMPPAFTFSMLARTFKKMQTATAAMADISRNNGRVRKCGDSVGSGERR
jgi:hypothetical protein